MTLAVRIVSLSSSADELLQKAAEDERQDPDVMASLILEMAIRERHALNERFASALLEIRNGRR
jgi:hypothetical protein